MKAGFIFTPRLTLGGTWSRGGGFVAAVLLLSLVLLLLLQQPTFAAEPETERSFKSEAKEFVCSYLGSHCRLAGRVFRAAESTLVQSSNSRLHWLYIVSSVFVAALIFLFRQKSRVTLGGFVKFLFPKTVFFHRSAIVDYQYFLLNGVIGRLIGFGTVIVSASALATAVSTFLGDVLGPGPLITDPGWRSHLFYSVLIFLAADLGFFISHLTLHKVPFFWEFHKVHHSAQVLTPITVERLHPVDLILTGFCISLLTGLVVGTLDYVVPLAVEYRIANFGAIFFVYSLTANFRHSHIWLSYGWHLSHVLSSPAQHQIHHSCDPLHADKNMGLVLSVWDWLCGTLYVPRQQENLTFGIDGKEDEQYQNLFKLYFLPVAKAANLTAGAGAKLVRSLANNGRH